MSNEFLRINVLNVPFINTTQAAFLTAVESRINHRQNTFIVTANPEIVMYARDDPSYQRILKNADYITGWHWHPQGRCHSGYAND